MAGAEDWGDDFEQALREQLEAEAGGRLDELVPPGAVDIVRVQVRGPDFHCCGQPMERGAVLVWAGYSLGPILGGASTAEARPAAIFRCHVCGQEAVAFIAADKVQTAGYSIREVK